MKERKDDARTRRSEGRPEPAATDPRPTATEADQAEPSEVASEFVAALATPLSQQGALGAAPVAAAADPRPSVVVPQTAEPAFPQPASYLPQENPLQGQAVVATFDPSADSAAALEAGPATNMNGSAHAGGETVTLPNANVARVDAATARELMHVVEGTHTSEPRSVEIERANEVLRQVRMHLSPSMKRATIELQPAELGRVSINVAVRDGRVSAYMRAENVQTLDLLERHAPELRSMLAQQGIEADSLQFELGFSDSSQNAFGETFGNASKEASKGNAEHSFQSRLEAEDELTTSDLVATAAFAVRSHGELGVDTYA